MCGTPVRRVSGLHQPTPAPSPEGSEGRGGSDNFTPSQGKSRRLNDKRQHNHLAQREKACSGLIVATVPLWGDSLFPRPLICVVLGGDDRQHWSSPLTCSFTVSSSSLRSLAVILFLVICTRHLLFHHQHLRLSDVAHYTYFYNILFYSSVSIPRPDWEMWKGMSFFFFRSVKPICLSSSFSYLTSQIC